LELTSITQEMYEISKRLDQASKSLYKLAKDKAETEREYRMKLAQEMLKLREEKMPATLIPDLARGQLADLKFNRDIAETYYKSALESLDAIKSQLTALQSILRYQEQI
jgi:hypothetical protein